MTHDNVQADIRDFLAGTHYAVVGASVDREKYGNKVLRAYLQKGHVCVPVHPREALIEGVACVRSVEELPFVPHGLSIVTPPPITEKVVDAALAKGIRRLWMQPGAEHEHGDGDGRGEEYRGVHKPTLTPAASRRWCVAVDQSDGE